MGSLRSKIKLGYFAFALIIGIISLFAYLDLRYVDRQIAQGVAASQLRESALEMRRYEKNFLLYHDEANRQQALQQAQQALTLLTQEREAISGIATAAQLAELELSLQQYRALLAALPLASDAAAEQSLRQSGHAISESATAVATHEREELRARVNHSQQALLGSIAILVFLSIAIGRVLSRAVVEPLSRLEQDLQPIAEGRFDALTIQSRDREIVSFAEAINRMLAELESRRRQLLHSEKLASLGVLVSGVAHELNNPLSNISTSAQLLLEELESAERTQKREWLEQIDEQTERARRIVRALLEFSRDTPFAVRPTALREVVDKSVLLLRSQLKRHLQVVCEVSPEITVAGDKNRLQQVFINLIGNAADASDEQGVVTIRAEQSRRNLLSLSPSAYIFGNERCGVHSDQAVTVITIADNGPGIAPEILPKVFDPFFTTKEVGHGMGLGLYVVMEIIEEHKGCIAVESEPGKGTRFTILLPSENAS